jgi:vacuolar protein sorting-associated protein 35
MESDISLDSVESIQNLFNFVTPLIKDEDDTPEDEGKEKTSFAIEQGLVCKMVHQIRTDDRDVEFQILTTLRQYFGQGGPNRMFHTLPPAIYTALGLISKLIKDAKQRQELGDEAPPAPAVSVKKVFQFIHKTTTVLVTVAPEIALQLWLAAAVMGDAVDKESPGSFEGICYEFLTQALICFEEEISESSKQYQGIFQLIGTLTNITCLEEENFETISTKVVQHSSRLLKKPMQCRAIAACSGLFWCAARQDGKRVLECLQKCLKITDVVVQSQPKEVGLWVEMMDKYIFYFESDCEECAPKFISGLKNLCEEHIAFAENNADSKPEAEKAQTHFSNSLAYIKAQKMSGSPEVKALFAQIEL